MPIPFLTVFCCICVQRGIYPSSAVVCYVFVQRERLERQMGCCANPAQGYVFLFLFTATTTRIRHVSPISYHATPLGRTKEGSTLLDLFLVRLPAARRVEPSSVVVCCVSVQGAFLSVQRGESHPSASSSCSVSMQKVGFYPSSSVIVFFVIYHSRCTRSRE